MPIRPGRLSTNQVDYSGFADSMAAAIEQELNALLAVDDLPALLMDANHREVRDRRRFFLAIARGVVRHLRDRQTSIDIHLPSGPVVHPVFNVEGLDNG
jgi:hypothetical protein